MWLSAVVLILVVSVPPFAHAQQNDTVQELRSELDRLKEQIARLEVLLAHLETEQKAQAETPLEQALQRAPAMNTPPMLPPSRPEAFQKTPPRFDVLMQVRGDFFPNTARNHTFFLRKAEVGLKGHITPHVDFSLELDPVRPNDPYRRTYLRLSHFERLHLKLGLEKAPIGLDELTPTGQLPFVDRSEVSDRFAAAEELGIHLESHWNRWLLQFAVTNGGRRLLRDDNRSKDATARVVWAPQPWFSWGFATLRGSAGEEGRNRDRYNTELKIGSNLSGLQSEFYRAQDGDIWSTAHYAAGYWAFPVRTSWLTHIQPVIRYERIGRSDRVKDNELRLLTIGFSLLFDEHRSKFQVNYLKDLLTGTRKDEVRAQYQIEF